MAVSHISIQKSSALGGQLYNAIDQLQSSLAKINELRLAMPYMVDGSNYAHLETQFGFETGRGELAKAEIDSLMAKLNSNAQTSDVNAALQQVFNYFA